MQSSPRERSTNARRKSISTTRVDGDAERTSDDYEDGRITVSVRVRPLNSRESKLATGSCVAALSAYHTLYIFPPGETQHDVGALIAQNPQLRGVAHHRFTFDHVYPTDATQEQVYEQIGHPVLQSSFHGYHTCIFAYGQTGSGKSYCMMGADGGRSIDDAPGIIPRLCKEMFAEMATRQAAAAAGGHDQVDFSVYVSYLEIYRERVRSLLDEATDAKVVTPKEPATPRSTVHALRRAAAALQTSDAGDGNLRVREHPTLGVYVEGLAEIPVTSVEQVMRLMVRGNQRRHTASTRMNDTSSRSHAIFTIQLLQQRVHTVPPYGEGDETNNSTEAVVEVAAAAATASVTEGTSTAVTATTQLGAKINLVDLAGSERAKATGAEGDTLKEGAQINKSLTTLGIVINALAAQSTASSGASPHFKPSGGAAKRHIPYRDSTLTFLLKESLGGNSKTFMIATVSPSTDNYDESVSTLRYADRAKAIVMRAFVNETAGDKRIRELEEEVNRLRERIKDLLDAEATRVPSGHADASPSLALSQSPPEVREPVVLADSESIPRAGSVGAEAGRERSRNNSAATDLDGAAPGVGEDNPSDEERDRCAASPPASPHSALPSESREAVVDSLQGELRRAEEMIRQMSVTQAERDAHIAKLVEEQEKERAATRAAAEAAAAAQQEAERVAAAAAAAVAAVSPVQTTTMRLHRDEPYLLNMDGAGDWIVAHLGPVQTLVGVFRSQKNEAVGEGERSSDDSYDSSLALPSSDDDGEPRAAAESAEEEGDPDNSSSTSAIRYVRLPPEFSDGVGSPHCALERSASSPSCTTCTVTLRGCAEWETTVIRPLLSSPLVVRGKAESLVLQSGDVLDMGHEHLQLKYMDPSAPPLTSRGRRTVPRIVGRGLPTSSSGGEEKTESERAMSSPSAPHAPWEPRRENWLRGNATPSHSLHDVRGEENAHEDTTTHSNTDKDEKRSAHSTDNETEEKEESYVDSDDSPMNSPAEQPGRAIELPSRPVIPMLALGTALGTASPTSALPLVYSTSQQKMQQQQLHVDPTAGDAGTMSNDGEDGPAATTSSAPSSDWTHSNPSLHATRHNTTDKVLTFEEPSAPAQQPLQFKSRKPSQRAKAVDAAMDGVAPHATLSASELQSMRGTATSSTYRSELPARFVGRYNVVLVGPSGAGKSSLVSNLAAPDQLWLRSAFSAFTSSARGTGSRNASSATTSVDPTIGIKARTLTVAGQIPMSLYTQELGGTPCFSPLLDQLPSHRVIYLLCFPLNGLTSLMTLRGVVEDILCRTASHTVSLVLVGTHADRNASGKEDGSYLSRLPVARQELLQRQLEEVEQQVVSLIQMLQPYPQLRPTVVGRFAADNVHRHIYATGFQAVEGFPQWLQWLGDLARDRCKADADFANGLVPARCLELGRQVSLLRQHGKWCVALRDFKTLAAAVSSQYKADAAEPVRTVSQPVPVARDSLRQHVQLLADWGVLMHRYRSLPLRQHIILDVVWLSRLLAALACCPLVAAAASDGLSMEEAATIVDVVGEDGAMSLTRKEAALRTLLTPEAEKVVDMVKVATTDTPHLLRSGVLSLPVLIAMLEPHCKRGGGSDAQKAVVGRTVDNAGGANEHGDAMSRYAVPLVGVIELLTLLDLIIVGRKLAVSPTNAATTLDDKTRAALTAAKRAAKNDERNDEATDDVDAVDGVEKESFVLYPLSFRTPASAGVTWLFPCFLSGPFYVFKMDMVPRNFFPKLLCRLATVADKIYLGPVEEKLWGSATQRWARDPVRERSSVNKRTGPSAGGAASSVATASIAGPFDSYFEQRAGHPFVLPSFSPYLATTTADGRLRRRDGFWFDAAWLVYNGEEETSSNHNSGSSGTAARDDGCRVLVRLVHHSVFLSFHCHSVAAASSPAASHREGTSAGVQDFYEAVLEAVRYVVEEFPGGKCEESMQCCVDPATLLQSEQQHPAIQSDQEAAAQERYMRFARISDNINNLERVLSKSGAALRTARTARRPNAVLSGARHRADPVAEDESDYVPLLRDFTATPPLSIHECIRRWKAEQRLCIAPDVEARLTAVLHELEECYHGDIPLGSRNSCAALDCLLDVLARVDTA